MPSISQLKYIVAVHRHGHFGRAARACHVSQPTLSAQIQKAEDELGIKLFVRQNKPVSPTERGAAVIEQAQIVLAAHERMLRLAKGKFEELAGDLSLAVIPTLAPYVLPWFLDTFTRRHPLVRLSVTERTTEEIVQGLSRQSLDVGLVATPLRESRLKERKLFEDPFYLYAAPSEPILEHEEVRAEDLDPEKMWILEEGHCVRNQTLTLCNAPAKKSLLSRVNFEAGSFETLKNLIDVSYGYTIIPETFARQIPAERRRKQVRAFSGITPTREVSLVHLKNTWKPDMFDRLEYVIMTSLPRPFRTAPSGSIVLPVRPE